MKVIMERLTRAIRLRSSFLRRLFSEMFGTFLLVVIFDGSVAQLLLLGHDLSQFPYLLNLTIGIAVALAIYVSLGVSGAHLNPCITFSFATVGKIRWAWVPGYMLAQFIGSLIGISITYGIYNDALIAAGIPINETRVIYTTYPGDHVTYGLGFADQVLGSALFLTFVVAAFDKKNCDPGPAISPILVGLDVFVVSCCFGYNTGVPLNLARDLLGRLFFGFISDSYEESFKFHGGHWWWVPIIAPLFGSSLGCWLYYLFVEAHHPSEEDDEYDVKPGTGTSESESVPKQLLTGDGGAVNEAYL